MTPAKLYIRAWRAVRGLSLRQLEDATGIGRGMLSHYERGQRSPNMDTLDRLAKGLSISVADLFTGPLTKTQRRPRRTR